MFLWVDLNRPQKTLWNLGSWLHSLYGCILFSFGLCLDKTRIFVNEGFGLYRTQTRILWARPTQLFPLMSRRKIQNDTSTALFFAFREFSYRSTYYLTNTHRELSFTRKWLLELSPSFPQQSQSLSPIVVEQPTKLLLWLRPGLSDPTFFGAHGWVPIVYGFRLRVSEARHQRSGLSLLQSLWASQLRKSHFPTLLKTVFFPLRLDKNFPPTLDD